jgi:SAM-dependent methyltransferase
MTAVDLEALGLEEAGVSSSTLPIQRLPSPGIESVVTTASESSGAGVRFTKRDATDPVDDVDVDIDSDSDSGMDAMDSLDGPFDGRSRLARGSNVHGDADHELGDDVSGGEVSDDDVSDEAISDDDVSDEDAELSEMETDDLAVIAPPVREVSPPRPAMPESSQLRPAMPESSQPRPAMPVTAIPPVVPPAIGFKPSRAPTVALSEEDLEEVREAARLATIPLARPVSTSIPPPMPASKPVEARPRSAEPLSVPEIDIMALDDKVSGEFEVDVEGIVEARSAPVAIPASPASLSGPTALPDQRTRQPSNPPPLGHGHAPPSSAPQQGHPPSNPPPLGHGHPISTQSGSQQLPRDSQPIPIVRDAPHAAPPPPPVAHKAPPSPPPGKKDRAPAPAIAAPGAKPDGKPPRSKPWFVDLFDEDYLRTLPFLTPQATQAEAEFVIDAMGLTPGAQVLDVGCGYGRHAMELAARGFHVVGLDMSTPLLVRGGEEAHRRGLTINFVRGDMRELDFEAQFDGAYCLFSTFGYFDDETNKKTIANIARALKPGGRVLIEILNRDYVISDLPTRVWWEGDGCVVLEEVELNYFSSRIQVNRSVVFDDGRQLEQDISVRAYSLHEVGKLLHAAGFRVLEVSGAYHTRGRFFGNQSRHIIVLAERKDPGAT